MFHLLKHLLVAYGKYQEQKRDTYKPQYNGQWIDKGKGDNEKWQWVEDTSHKQFVNILEVADGVILRVQSSIDGNAIDHVVCRDDSEVRIALRLLDVYYGTLGTVTIDKTSQ